MEIKWLINSLWDSTALTSDKLKSDISVVSWNVFFSRPLHTLLVSFLDSKKWLNDEFHDCVMSESPTIGEGASQFVKSLLSIESMLQRRVRTRQNPLQGQDLQQRCCKLYPRDVCHQLFTFFNLQLKPTVYTCNSLLGCKCYEQWAYCFFKIPLFDVSFSHSFT